MSKTGPRAGTTVKAEVTSFLSRAPLKAFRRQGGSCVRLRELEPSVPQLRVSAPAAGEPPLTPPAPSGHRQVTAAPAPGAQGGLSPHGRPSPQRPRLSDGTPPPCPAPARAGRAQRQSEEARVRRARSASRPRPPAWPAPAARPRPPWASGAPRQAAAESRCEAADHWTLGRTPREGRYLQSPWSPSSSPGLPSTSPRS